MEGFWLEGGDKIELADVSFVLMSYRSQLTAERRREERVKGRSHPARVSWEMRWVVMSFSAHKPGDRNPPALPCTLCVRPVLLFLQISIWIFFFGFCIFVFFQILPLQGWWEDCRLMCLEVSEGLETVWNMLRFVHHTGLVSGCMWTSQQGTLLLCV